MMTLNGFNLLLLDELIVPFWTRDELSREDDRNRLYTQ